MNVYLLTSALKKRSYHPFNAVILYISSTNIVVKWKTFLYPAVSFLNNIIGNFSTTIQ